jgi:hypothetical protein
VPLVDMETLANEIGYAVFMQLVKEIKGIKEEE